MAEEKRDFLDDLIDIQADWKAIESMPNDIAKSLTEDPDKKKVFNPSSYKEKPFANANRCLNVASGDVGLCSRCVQVCPTHSIKLLRQSVAIDEDCRKCGLCVTVCPMEALSTRRHTPRQVYDQIARAASSYEECYVTCTRAIKRIPQGNEIVLACVGDVSRDMWFSLLADYTNISVYLPVGICDRCRTTTGESVYMDAISTAEEWAVTSLNLVVNERELNHELSRNYKRSQFMSSAVKSVAQSATKNNKTLAGAEAVAKKINDHSKRIDQIQRDLETAVGAKTSANRQRVLTQNRKLMMGALQHDEGLADYVKLTVPVCDASLCTMCNECTKVCSTRAIDLDKSGHITVQSAYCMSCEACVQACVDGALSMEPMDVHELIYPDKAAEEAARQKAKAKAESAKYIEEGKKALSGVADKLEALDTEDSDSSASSSSSSSASK